MTQVIDQSDDGEFVVQSEEVRAKWYQQYLQTTGGWPPDEEDPTLGTSEHPGTSASTRRTSHRLWILGFGFPFGSKAMRASRLRALCIDLQRVRHEGAAWACNFRAMEGILQNTSHCINGDVGRSVACIAPCLRDGNREAHAHGLIQRHGM